MYRHAASYMIRFSIWWWRVKEPGGGEFWSSDGLYSANGSFSSDAQDGGTEWWVMNPVHEIGGVALTNCNNWTSNDSGVYGIVGNIGFADGNWLSMGRSTGDSLHRVICLAVVPVE